MLYSYMLHNSYILSEKDKRDHHLDEVMSLDGTHESERRLIMMNTQVGSSGYNRAGP